MDDVAGPSKSVREGEKPTTNAAAGSSSSKKKEDDKDRSGGGGAKPKKETPKKKKSTRSNPEDDDIQPPIDLRQCKLGLIIGHQIGSGSFAKVYKAYSCSRQKDVAVKIFKRSDIPENYFNKFIVREIEVIKELRHRNLVKFYDCQFTTKRYNILLFNRSRPFCFMVVTC